MKLVSLFVASALLASAAIVPASAGFRCESTVSCSAPIPMPPAPPPPPTCTVSVTCRF